jgi:hypothetical protein
MRSSGFESFTPEESVRRVHRIVGPIQAAGICVADATIFVDEYIPGLAGSGNIADPSWLEGTDVIVDDVTVWREGFLGPSTIEAGVNAAIVFQVGKRRGEGAIDIKSVVCRGDELRSIGVPKNHTVAEVTPTKSNTGGRLGLKFTRFLAAGFQGLPIVPDGAKGEEDPIVGFGTMEEFERCSKT